MERRAKTSEAGHQGVEVRWATLEDLDSIRNVFRRTLTASNEPDLDPAELDALLSGHLPVSYSWDSAGSRWLGTLLGDSQSGVVGASMLVSGPGTAGEVRALYVAPEWQGQGVGSSLWSASMAALKRFAFRSATVWALETNLRARRFYENRGCREFGRGTATFGTTPHPAIGYQVDLT